MLKFCEQLKYPPTDLRGQQKYFLCVCCRPISHALVKGVLFYCITHHLAPFFFLAGDFSELADPGCCDFFGCASRLVICGVK